MWGRVLCVADGADPPVAVSIADAIKGFDLREIRVDGLELTAQPLDVAVDRPVVDVNVLPISRVHQLVAVLYMPWAMGERFEDQKLGHGKLDRLAVPGAQVPGGIEDQPTAHNHRLALRIVALASQFATPDQGADALNQQPLRKRLLDVVVGAHSEAQQLVDLVILRGQEDHGDRALSTKLAEQLHAVHPRHLDVEHGNIDRLGAQAF